MQYSASSHGHAYAAIEIAALVEGCNPHALIILVFDRIDRALAAMATAISHNNLALRNHYHAQSMMQIRGLQEALDMDRGGVVAQALADAYEMIANMLNRALIANDRSLVKAARSYMNDIADAWKSIG